MGISTGNDGGSDGDLSMHHGQPENDAGSPCSREPAPNLHAEVHAVLERIRALIGPHLDRIWDITQRHPELFNMPNRMDLETIILTPTVQAILSEPGVPLERERLISSLNANLVSLYRHAGEHNRQGVRSVLQTETGAGGSGIYRRGRARRPMSADDIRDAVREHSREVAVRAALEQKARQFNERLYQSLTRCHFQRLGYGRWDLSRIRGVYDQRLMRDEAFEHLLRGDMRSLEQIASRGGMIHRFTPTKPEQRVLRRLYRERGQTYRSPQDDLIAKMTGRDGKKGEYRVDGLVDPAAHLIAWLSYRIPPENPAEAGEYAAQMRALLDRAHISPHVRSDRMREETESAMEIDTIAAARPGSGSLLIHRVLSLLEKEGRKITSALLVRYQSMRLVYPPQTDQPTTPVHTPNMASQDFFRKRGFVDIGYVYDPDEVACRKTRRGVVGVSPTWSLMYAPFRTVVRASEEEWRRTECLHSMHQELRRDTEDR